MLKGEQTRKEIEREERELNLGLGKEEEIKRLHHLSNKKQQNVTEVQECGKQQTGICDFSELEEAFAPFLGM